MQSLLHDRRLRLILACAASLCLAAGASAQLPSAADAPGNPPPSGGEPNPARDQVVNLDPFQVKTNKDTSYGALNSNSITRFNMELDKSPVVADIFTSEFIQDTQVQSVEELFQNYGVGAGMVLATPESDSTSTQPGDRFSVGQYGVRGVSAGSARRDGFDFSSTNTNATSLFDIERVEIIHGSQGLLYGATGAGGVINVVSKEAHFNQTTGTISTRIDQYGSQQGTVDANWGSDKFALRFSAIDQDDKYRRVIVGDTTKGYYAQGVVQLPLNTTLRVSAEATHNDRQVPNNISVNYGSTTVDPRNGDKLTYLLASNQVGTINPATGQPFVHGAIDNGLVNYYNDQSYAGWRTEEDVDNNMLEATLDTVWTKWFSTSFGTLWDKNQELRGTNSGSLTAPNFPGTNVITSNPFPNDWAMSSSFADSESPRRQKSYRASALFTFDLFGGRAHSQTSAGFDREYNDSSGGIGYEYYLAGSDGTVALDPTKSNLGRTQLPTLWWTVDNGPVNYAFPKVGAKAISYDGSQGGTAGTYVRMPTNPRGPQWVTANNPLGLASLYPGITGVSGGNSGGFAQQTRSQGYFVANYTSWFHDQFDTLLGFRESSIFTRNPNTSTAITMPWIEKDSGYLPSYNAGIVSAIPGLSWLRAYYEYSRTFDTSVGSNDALGDAPPYPIGVTHEVGLKFHDPRSQISGDAVAYYTKSHNDNYNAGTTYENIVNPVGLNGSAVGTGGSRNQWATFDKVSKGIEADLTAQPTPNWRLRFGANWSDGTVLTDAKYNMVYNDQFYTDAAGNVTYANGKPFLVPDATNAAAAAAVTALGKQSSKVDPSTAAPYSTAPMVPLTLAMLDNPSSPYYVWGVGTTPANEPLNGSIGGAQGGTVNALVKNALGQFQNAGTTALTGRVGLPVSAMQYVWHDPANYGGTYYVYHKGDATVGYPVLSTTFTTKYDFDRGWLKGFGIGGSLNLAWWVREFWFSSPDRSRGLFEAPPTNPQVNAIFSYRIKLARTYWQTQLNINNLFNRYSVGIFPQNGTAFTNPANVGATLYGVPRTYVWSNTIQF